MRKTKTPQSPPVSSNSNGDQAADPNQARSAETTGDERSFQITGMTCANCSRNVERALSKVAGVDFAAVNLATETAFVNLSRDLAQKELEAAVERAGYGVSYERVEDLDQQRYRAARRELLLSWSVTLPLMVLMILHMTGTRIPYFYWMELFGAAFVIVAAGWRTFRGAWIAGIHGHTNMDTLIVAGATASWATTALNLAGVSIASFGTIGAMIVALHVSGRFIESRLRDKASKAIKSLLRIQAREARILDENDQLVTVPIEAVKAGFAVVVRPGERIPTDGEIKSGDSAVDESMISGESLPVKKQPKDAVTGGSLNLTGKLVIEATQVGQDTFLSQMIALIQEAQGAKIPIQALADRITRYFVPAIILLAVLSGVLWYLFVDRLAPLLDWAAAYLPWVVASRDPLTVGVFAFVTTIVIACPCALGLATPMALIAGTGRASRMGLIIRNAEAIQTAKEVGTVVMDKTGTLTAGQPQVVDHDLDGPTLAAVAALERQSNHPLAKAISALAAAPGKPGGHAGSDERVADDAVENIEEIAGQGIFGKVGGDTYFVGRPQQAETYRHQLEKGRSVVEVKKNEVVVGYLAIADPLRPDSAQAVKQLKALGIEPVMASGDNEKTALAVAAQASIDKVHAGIRPKQKLTLIRDYQSAGRKVVMIGDGMNDAAALKGADIGVAVGSGTDLAIDNADIVIVDGGVSKLVDAIHISRRTFTVIRQNLFWAFAYNVIAIPLAMAALLHPVIAEAAMAFSSISVVLNSSRIAKIRNASAAHDVKRPKTMESKTDKVDEPGTETGVS
jgi:Cu+-exporting ATPase